MIDIKDSSDIHPSCIIGTKGFSFSPKYPRKILPTEYGIKIGEDNYIAGFCAIDLGLKRDTLIGNGNIIDSHVHISHDCIIGDNCELDTHCVLLGGVTLGNNVRICTGAIIHPDVTIGDNCVVGAGSYLRHDLAANKIAYGTPATEQENTKYEKYLKSIGGR